MIFQILRKNPQGLELTFALCYLASLLFEVFNCFDLQKISKIQICHQASCLRTRLNRFFLRKTNQGKQI